MQLLVEQVRRRWLLSDWLRSLLWIFQVYHMAAMSLRPSSLTTRNCCSCPCMGQLVTMDSLEGFRHLVFTGFHGSLGSLSVLWKPSCSWGSQDPSAHGTYGDFRPMGALGARWFDREVLHYGWGFHHLPTCLRLTACHTWPVSWLARTTDSRDSASLARVIDRSQHLSKTTQKPS